MKELQTNFTTQEQSKRLLEIGVPADSADCYYYAVGEKWGWEKPALRDESKPLGYNCTPCWSVGRMIEILHITYKQDLREYLYLCTTETCRKGLINQIMAYLEKYHKDHDFSKLEE